MAPRGTTWSRKPHTEGKHLVMKYYLDRWLPIVGRHSSRILIVDGFAGPGRYAHGEEGSPVIAMRSLVEHPAPIRSEVVFIFVEKDKKRYKCLKNIVAKWRPKLPERASAYVFKDNFNAFLSDQLDSLRVSRETLAPAFIMSDPFGIKGLGMPMIQRIFKNPMCEVFSTFMWHSIQRFVKTEEFKASLTNLFGTDAWQKCLDLQGREQMTFLFDLYGRCLKQAGAKHVVKFDLDSVYSIFFATRHPQGCNKMKEAIWKVIPDGSYRFLGGQGEQLLLDDLMKPDLSVLSAALVKEFGDIDWVSIEDIENYVSTDRTYFHRGQLREALRNMESEGGLEVSNRKRRNTYPPGCRIRFASKSHTLFPSSDLMSVKSNHERGA